MIEEVRGQFCAVIKLVSEGRSHLTLELNGGDEATLIDYQQIPMFGGSEKSGRCRRESGERRSPKFRNGEAQSTVLARFSGSAAVNSGPPTATIFSRGPGDNSQFDDNSSPSPSVAVFQGLVLAQLPDNRLLGIPFALYLHK